MKVRRTLHPEDLLSHYRVVGPLGAGGMGEVYLAQDQTLERNVALKVLPPELVADQDRVRRFVLEAKSASSLSHPNIVTIYEIGQDVVRPADTTTERDSAPVQFISMELISGKTLSTLIHDDKTDLRTLLGYLAQAAEGLAKAHAAGIVHRDLKPGNIMVSNDGFAKVLDFGLAKLSERRDANPEQTSAPTMVEDATGAGAILGTTGYMSPEQVQGKPADHRSDIFSFGCVLYEAATRQRPFVAESAVETMHKILHDKPVPIEERNAKAPAEFRRLVRRCLAKSPDQRLQSMKDIALELRDIADEWDSLSASGTSTGSGSGTHAQPLMVKQKPLLAITAVIAIIAIAAIAVAVWAVRRGGPTSATQPFQTMRMSIKTNRGDVTAAALSFDGRYLAYLTGEVGTSSVRVRQVATGADVEVVPSEEGLLEGLSFTPDGNYLFYLRRRRDAPSYRTLMQVPSLGGPSRERAFDVDSRVSFSPEGKRVVFIRGVPQEERTNLVVLDLDTAKERVLAAIKQPRTANSAPAWSPDGQHIAIFDLESTSGGLVSRLAVFDQENGDRTDVSVTRNALSESLAWLADGSGLVQSAVDLSRSITRQISLVTYPDGNVRPVTNDLNEYFHLTTSSGDEAIAAVRQNRLSNLWLADPSGGEAVAITRYTSTEDSPSQSVTVDDGSIVFSAARDRSVQLWSIGVKGGEPRLLTDGDSLTINPRRTPGGLAFQRYDRNKGMHIWRSAPDGSGARLLLPDTAASLVDVAPDGSFFIFDKTDLDDGEWVMSMEGGTPRSLGARSNNASISPDSSRILFNELEPSPDGLIRSLLKIVPAAGGPEVARLPRPVNAGPLEWGVDNASLTFVDISDPAWNLRRLAVDGRKSELLTRFSDGRCMTFEWSPDRSQIAIARRVGSSSNVWIVNADGSKPVQVTRFGNDEIFALSWTQDGKHVVVNAGKYSSDAVMITNFR